MDDFARVKAAVDIVDVIGEHVALKKSGSRLVGLCPFHQEKTPSFSVNLPGQYFKCFGCGKGGDVFVFLQEIERLEPREALQRLAEKAGVTLERPDPQHRKRKQQEERVFEALDLARKAFATSLQGPAGESVRRFVVGRGIDEETCRAFDLGFARGGRQDLRDRLHAAHISDEDQEAAGLLYRGDRGTRDAFRNRLMIPIRDDRGRTVGFGARRLKDGPDAPEPKYMNSRENPVFHKSRVLYGIDRARSAILKGDRTVLVEGYMDVILAHQAGVTEAVAALGTAITAEHARLLKRLCPEVVLFLDGDAAGQRASAKAVPLLLAEGLRVRVLALPEGEDPGDFFAAGRDRADFAELLEHDAEPGLDFLLRQTGARRARSFEERSAVAEQLADALCALREPLRRAAAVQHVAKELGFPAEALESSIQKRAGRTSRAVPPRVTPEETSRRAPSPGIGARRSAQRIAQEELLIALLHQRELREVAPQIVPADSFSDPLLARLFTLVTGSPSADVPGLLGLVAGERDIQPVLLDLAERPAPSDAGRLFDGAVRFFEQELRTRASDQLKQRYREALDGGDADSVRRFLAEYRTLQARGPGSSTGPQGVPEEKKNT